MDNTRKIHNFINDKKQFIDDLFNEHYNKSDPETYRLVYIQLKDLQNIEIAYLTFDQLKRTGLLDEYKLKGIIDIKRHVIYCNNMIDDHQSVLIVK